jgi:hypothetical protein
MPSNRASAVALGATAIGAALLCLVGCASSRLSSQTPPDERLAGDWQLDRARSDDLGNAIAQLRAQIAKAHRGREDHGQQPSFGSYGRRHGRGGGAQQGGSSGQDGSLAGGEGGGQELGPGSMPSVSPVDELMSNVPRGDYLRITVSHSAFTVISGDSSNEYTPGLESEISAEQGDAQQISGWKDAAYVIDTTPQWGPEIIQRFELTKDGKLAMTLRLSGKKIHFILTRIYDRSTHVAPLAPPTTN